MELKIGDNVIDIENLKLGIGVVQDVVGPTVKIVYNCTVRFYLKRKADKIFNQINSLRVINENETNTVAKPKWQFTEDEKTILRNLPNKFKWIARDADQMLYLYGGEPHKERSCWTDLILDDFAFYEHIFQTIQWDDEEPCEFRKYI